MVDNDLEMGYTRRRLGEIRGDPDKPLDTTIGIPVNAQNDLENVLNIIRDIVSYEGTHTFEIVLVVNNYPPEDAPAMIEKYAEMGIRVIAIPNVRRPGEAPGFTARLHSVRTAATDSVILFDADCRIRNATALIDWYIKQFKDGADVAYSHVQYYQVTRHPSIMLQLFVHHASRWFKRNILDIPTTRGSNYAVRKSVIVPYYEEGWLADELNVGPTVKKKGGQVVYSGSRELVVQTSGRKFKPGWHKLYRYLLYRLRYNLRVLPVGADVARRTRRENESVRHNVDNESAESDK